MADDEEEVPPPPPKKRIFSSFLPGLAVMVGLSILASVIGGGLGIELVGVTKANIQETAKKAAALRPGADTTLVDLPPIITNLADPPDAWVRLQTAIVVDNKAVMKPEVLGAEISDDLLGFMKTVTLAQIGGASGLQHLREDLTERAAIRSHGHVRELIIQALVVQ